VSSLVAVPAPPDRAAEGGAGTSALRPAHGSPVTLAEVARAAGAPGPGSGAALVVGGVTHDSRAVRPGDLYAALPGSNAHGARFVAQAVAAGAVAVLTDPAGRDLVAAGDAVGVPLVVVDDPRAVLGEVAATVHGHPAERLLVLGVTGTNGKTTTCYLLEAALRAAGRRTGLVGTVETRIDDERVPSVRTTPESTDLQALLAVMVERGVQACAMEVSSHALSLHRVDGIVYDVAGFTNLSQDHLDFHPDLEHYYAAKASLFTPARSRRAVVCVDDAWGRRVAADAAASGLPVTTVATPALDDPALTRAGADGPTWRAVELAPAADGVGTRFVLLGPDGRRRPLVSPLPGDFNVANTAVAALVLTGAGLDEEQAAAGLAGAGGVPGRMEVVPGPPGAPLSVVDYAHSPEAVAVALRALRGRTRGRLVVVLGAGGDRDAGKRPAMGEAAALGADVVVVTDDNPRSEDPAAIRAAVLAGATAATAALRGREVVVTEVGERREAVAAAVRLAREVPGSTVLVAGKGHETGQEVAGTVHPFDDRAVLAELLAATTPGTQVAAP
jgi:UDP-N-acetylmuramoyl-L-alanyl-D-glutamate--2,6-diaminopimelate ligase